ncbi:hypothetical protein ABBQ38_003707 [Trebouxia sp. C0009 RCD-2024]
MSVPSRAILPFANYEDLHLGPGAAGKHSWKVTPVVVTSCTQSLADMQERAQAFPDAFASGGLKANNRPAYRPASKPSSTSGEHL